MSSQEFEFIPNKYGSGGKIVPVPRTDLWLSMMFCAGAGFVALMLWYYIRVILRGLFDFVNQITMFILEQHLYLFILGGGLLCYVVWRSLIGRKSLVSVWSIASMAFGSFAILFGYWGYPLVKLPGELTGQYVRSDHKARLTIKGDSIYIWSGKKHLSGRCEFLPCFSHTAAKTRISGFPLTGTESGLFSMSIEDIHGETIYRLEPTADSLFIHTDSGTIIRYGRTKR